MTTLLDRLTPAVPTIVVLLSIGVALLGVHLWYRWRRGTGQGGRFRKQIAGIIVFLFGLLSVVLVIPIGEERRGQLLGLIGVLLSAMIALSSATVLGNALAGLMMRAQRSFRAGDFLQVEEHFGRVAERGLFHTQIQTEDRDLTTFPNVYLSTRPMTVLKSPETLASSTVSLGYDAPRKQIETALLLAAEQAGLKDPFVRILDLGDFSVTYRVSGLLDEVRQIVSTRSRLNAKVLDELHAAGIEIVSPNFINQRVWPTDRPFIPAPIPTPAEDSDPTQPIEVESLMFDKAEMAESIEQLRDLQEFLTERIQELRSGDTDSPEGDDQGSAKEQIERLEAKKEWLTGLIERRKKDNQK